METFDLCNIYDIDYSLINKMAVESGKTAKNYSQGDITMKKCTEFVFNTTVNSETEMSSIVTDVSYSTTLRMIDGMTYLAKCIKMLAIIQECE